MRLIDADALFNKALKIWGFEASISDTSVFMDAIVDAPTIDYKPDRHGTWFGTVCSACGSSVSFYFDCNYCPICGAKMDLEEST